ncbi:D-alanyl-D-alanine carboxypeptidase [Methylocaldum marinum]|uniref:serine-type D-Ala-D-Ala carboxypeptidase n=1 Tax=Methylocaldum marinum TaxID=1432792 RepID=A0A250KUR7_9GAMM|nr:D-alanyl-D-alanine carboxypeptidase family protein [Methylocaldum marinum]BBA35264.1 D-alanyl-D-alanine carboxypeptidase [Methylocaldum marinum]
MKINLPSLLFLFALAGLSRLSLADQVLIPAPPEIGAKAYILEDFNSGRVLAEGNADERLEPASLTKIMTAYIVFRELTEGHLKLDDMVRVSEKAWRTEGSRMFAQVGAQIPVEALLKGMIIQSGNDASVALAEHIAGDEAVFAQMMNQQAERLGMKNTHFKNSMGLPDPEHYSTARDLVTLTRAMIEEFPEYYKWHAIKEYEFNGIKQHNRNRLLWRDPTVDGVKTGHTSGAGFCLVASAMRDGMRLISVVLGGKSDRDRANANQALLNYGYRFFETRALYKAGEKLSETRVWKGEETELALGLRHDFHVTFPRGQYQNLKAGIEVDSMVIAPIKQGDRLGMVKVTFNDQTVGQQDLVALKTVDQGGFFRRTFDQAQLFFK